MSQSIHGSSTRTAERLPVPPTKGERQRVISSRRRWLTEVVAAGFAAALWKPAVSWAATSSRWLEIEDVERTPVLLNYREIPARAMARELPHWRYFELIRVRLKSGAVGWGETMPFYTWGAESDAMLAAARGRSAWDIMWNPAHVGAGLQMALLDAVARTLDCPVHALLGTKCYDRTPLSWWNIDMPPADMAAECRYAHQQGYLSYKTKGRPWYDLWAQMEQSAAVVPPEFKIDMDFNDTLRDADRALPILLELEKYPQADIWETPIPQADLEGNRRITAACRAKIAMHYGNPAPKDVFATSACDGFVAGGHARQLLDLAAVCEVHGTPFWLQMVGSGLTAALSLHFGGVLQQARWPAVNCHQLFEHDLLSEPIVVRDGSAAVPDAPGLGYTIDPGQVAKHRCERMTTRLNPPRLVEVRPADGRKLYLADQENTNFMLTAANDEIIPFFSRGITTQLIPNDGSAGWRSLHEAARQAPVWK